MEKKHFDYETGDPVHYSLLKKMAAENKLFATDAERALWSMLKANNIGLKFRRQHIIGDYIVDFVNLSHKLIVEVDGKYHFKGEQPVKDAIRTEELRQKGYHMLRLTNDEVIGNSFQVINKIKKKIMEIDNAQPQSPLPLGRVGVGSGIDLSAWAVDAACSGNPGPMEYQAIDLATGAVVFHYGPVHGTNNIGEFLAIVHALALMEQRGIKDKAIYSDSYNAILWVRKKQCKTKLARTPQTEQLYQVIARAEAWLRTHTITTPILKWETKQWGEIPADFGRK
ncbi:DUF559 domain-containing protein [Prevotella sp. kh1p2]|uniref:DUF559 domain-containing protein n=1 Tax=Prevotella sp. kh1p2 TaxID=1761883 RepID=UPI0008CC341B|nr:Very-short-patch-repair endonuclease [Prevotella sp. kh1p2]SNU11590.1 Very-short-patch-repair endonuclease [Prevotellaceae bacterium KH2P17]